MTTAPPTSEHHGPPHSCSSSSPLGGSRQLQGPDLHYRDRPLTAQPLRRPYPSWHTARRRETNSSFINKMCCFFCSNVCISYRNLALVDLNVKRVMLQNFKIVVILLLVHPEITKWNCLFVGQYLPQLTVSQVSQT